MGDKKVPDDLVKAMSNPANDSDTRTMAVIKAGDKSFVPEEFNTGEMRSQDWGIFDAVQAAKNNKFNTM